MICVFGSVLHQHVAGYFVGVLSQHWICSITETLWAWVFLPPPCSQKTLHTSFHLAEQQFVWGRSQSKSSVYLEDDYQRIWTCISTARTAFYTNMWFHKCSEANAWIKQENSEKLEVNILKNGPSLSAFPLISTCLTSRSTLITGCKSLIWNTIWHLQYK